MFSVISPSEETNQYHIKQFPRGFLTLLIEFILDDNEVWGSSANVDWVVINSRCCVLSVESLFLLSYPKTRIKSTSLVIKILTFMSKNGYLLTPSLSYAPPTILLRRPFFSHPPFFFFSPLNCASILRRRPSISVVLSRIAFSDWNR